MTLNENLHRRTRLRRQAGKYFALSVFIGLVAIPITWFGLNGEVARWQAARAYLRIEQGQVEEGIQWLERAHHRAPHDSRLTLELASQWMQNGRADQALELAEAVLHGTTNRIPALRVKASCLMYLGEPEQALQSIKEISDLLDERDLRSPDRLNELAYFRALAGIELTQAREDIEEAIAIQGYQMWWLDKISPGSWLNQTTLPLRDQTLIAAAVISRQVDSQEIVLPLLNSRIDDYQQMLQESQSQVSNLVYVSMVEMIPFRKSLEQEIQARQITVGSYRHFLTLFRGVRALIYQDQGDYQACDRDRLATRQLDQDVDTLIEQIPDDWFLLTNQLYMGAQYLDTRAVVNQRHSRELLVALADLNVAVLAIEILQKTDDGPLRNTLRDEGAVRFDPNQIGRTEAVLRKHRAELTTQLGLFQEAQADYRRIEELGFQRNEPLF